MSNSWRTALLIGGYPTSAAEEARAFSGGHADAMRARVVSFPRAVSRGVRLSVWEAAAVLYLAAAIVLLERLPVTYPRGALLAVAVAPVASMLVVAFGVTLLRRFALRRDLAGAETLASKSRFFLRAAGAFLLVLNGHFLLKSFITLFNPAVWDPVLERVDRALLGGTSPSELLTRVFSLPATLTLLDVVYSVLYYLLFVGCTGTLLALLAPARRKAFVAAFVFLWISGSVLYLLVPSWGPVFVTPETFQGVLPHMPVTVAVQTALHEEIHSLVRNPLAPRVVRYGCVAAFPSLHIGLLTLFALASRSVSRSWYRVNLLLLLLMVLGSVVTGYHYLVDSPAGAALAALCWFAGCRLTRSAPQAVEAPQPLLATRPAA